jgi:histidinol dehydrogenase
VIRRLDLRGQALRARALRGLVPRAELGVDHAVEQVRPIVAQVRERGVEALIELTERFDGVRLTSVRVPGRALAQALDQLDPAVRAGLEESIARARVVHAGQRRTDHTSTVAPGGTVTERWVPVGRVGLYVPGGLAVYPSSVVMNVIPAQEAGVPSIAVTSPAQRDNPAGFEGLPNPTILAACALLDVREVYSVGGAQAVAMLAYGATDATGEFVCEPVDLVTGPGNIWVAAAKRLLRGVVGIDAEAGPTEVAVLADDSADPAHVAADLISQAEHDPMAASVLVTDSEALADAVETELVRQVATTRHVERIRTALGGPQSGIVLVDDVDAGLEVVDAYAAEHLEIHTRDAAAVASRVTNAGAIFVGPWAPVSLGDYCAGSNHVLPTGGSACYSSGLSVQSFLRGVHVVNCTREALADVADHVVTLAHAEDLPAHGQAVRVRLPQGAVPAPTTADLLARLPLREDLRGRTPYGAPQLDVAVRLNTNENPYDVPPEVAEAIVEAVRDEVASLNRYPDREFTALRVDLAEYLGHDLVPEQIWAGNGSNEVLQHVVQAFAGRGRTALGFMPAYSMHPIISVGSGTAWVDGLRGVEHDPFDLTPEHAVEQVLRHAPHVVFLCSPNNPTGTALDLDVVEAVYEATDGMVVVDEAYAEFTRPGTPSALTLLPGRERLVVTRTMSKAFALAGARLGYLAADPAVCDAFRLVRMPYHLSSLAQAAARAALWHADVLLSTVEAVKAQRDRIVAALAAMGLAPVPSDANFVLVGGLGDERAVWRGLITRQVLVRDVGIAHHLRVTAGTPAETTAFLDALSETLREQ